MDRDLARKYAAEYAQKAVDAIRWYEHYSREYEAVQAAYRKPGRAAEVAESRAASDPRLTKAAVHGPWFRDQAAAYAAITTALCTYADGAP